VRREPVVFTDLDGTLLDHESYRFDAAAEALATLKARAIPLVIVTSKTRPEVMRLQQRLGISEVFIVENGAGAFVPEGSILSEKGECAALWDEQGYDAIRGFFATLQQRFDIRGFGDMEVAEVMRLTGLEEREAADAKRRDFTEPFVAADRGQIPAIREAANAEGFDIIEGGRFFHLVTRGATKGRALEAVAARYAEHYGRPVLTLALGDGANDRPMLEAADRAVLIPHPDGRYEPMEIPGLIPARYPGPKGWNAALQTLLFSPRQDALRIYAAAVDAVAPAAMIRSACKLEGQTLTIGTVSYDLGAYRNIYLCGAGKAAWTMAEAVEALLGARIRGGVIVAPEIPAPLRFVETVKGAHPVPDAGSLEGARKLMDAMQRCDKGDLMLFLLSGGSSALIEAPLGAISLEALRDTTSRMLQCDMAIGEINTVRKHLSAVKGGRLGSLCRAECAVLVVSDVIGDDLEVIGSAPMYRDRSTFADAKGVLEEAGIFDALDPAVREVIEAGCAGKIPESPDSAGQQIRHFLIGGNATALAAAADEARRLGYDTAVADEMLQGDANACGRALVARSRRETVQGHPLCRIYGGETTVQVTGTGRGGRNQQLCLSALGALHPDEALTLLCAGSDGIDGNSDAAGAVVDASSLEKAAEQGLSVAAHLVDNDANTFFAKTGDLIVTGPSGTNVMDIALMLLGNGKSRDSV